MASQSLDYLTAGSASPTPSLDDTAAAPDGPPTGFALEYTGPGTLPGFPFELDVR